MAVTACVVVAHAHAIVAVCQSASSFPYCCVSTSSNRHVESDTPIIYPVQTAARGELLLGMATACAGPLPSP
jgi:hypothetical protein